MARSFEPNGGSHEATEHHIDVARLGRRALEEGELEPLMEDACRLVLDALGMDYATVLEVIARKDEALPRAGVGWKDLQMAASLGPASQAGYALETGDRVLVEDLDADERFAASTRLERHGVASGITVLIGPPRDPWGFLEAHSTRPRTLTQDDAALMQSVANVLASRLRTEQAQNRARMEEARGVLEASAEKVLDRVTDAFYAVDEEYRFTRVNDRAGEILQRPEEELLGRSLWDVFPEAREIPEVYEAFETALEEQETTGYELYYPPLDAWVSARLYPSKTGISVYFRDVTERKERERRLMESEARFRTLAETLDEVIWMTTDDPAEILYVNPAIEDVFGVDPETLYETPEMFLEAVHPEDQDRVEEAYFGMQDGAYDEEYRILRPSGEVRWLDARAAAVEDDAGRVHRIVGIAEDITKRKERETQIREEKEQFEALVSEVEEYSIVLLDLEGRVRSWNAGAEKIHGYAEDEIIGEPFTRFYPKDDPSHGLPQTKLEQAIQEGSVEEEGWRVRKDGSRFWAHTVVTPLHDEAGNLRGFSEVLKDMTERRSYERALAASEKRHRLLIENFPDGAVGMYDEDLRITLAGGTALATIGLQAEDLIGATAWERYPEDLIDAIEDDLLAVFNGEPRTFEATYKGRDWLAHTHPVPSEDGGETLGMIVIQDVTERKRMEEDLRESQDLYETLVQNFPNGHVALVGSDLRYRIVGGTPIDPTVEDATELEGKHVSEALSQGLADVLTPRYEEALEGEATEVEHQHEGHHVLFRIVPVRGEDGSVFAALGISQDITARREYQRQLEESNAHLEQFAYAASHDLQEPLRMIATYLQLIHKRYADAFDEDGRTYLGYAVEGARRMQAMIQSLLAFSRVAREPPTLQPIDANDILDGVLTDLRMRIEETHARVTYDDLPKVRADPDQIAQVLRNLIQNALTFSGDDPPRIHVTAEPTDGWWRIEVHDEGIGIDPAYADKIFDMFERIPHEGAPVGTGVGLALSRQVINRHGGKMGVESQPGEGSTFHFTLPGEDAPDRHA